MCGWAGVCCRASTLPGLVLCQDHCAPARAKPSQHGRWLAPHITPHSTIWPPPPPAVASRASVTVASPAGISEPALLLGCRVCRSTGSPEWQQTLVAEGDHQQGGGGLFSEVLQPASDPLILRCLQVGGWGWDAAGGRRCGVVWSGVSKTACIESWGILGCCQAASLQHVVLTPLAGGADGRQQQRQQQPGDGASAVCSACLAQAVGRGGSRGAVAAHRLPAAVGHPAAGAGLSSMPSSTALAPVVTCSPACKWQVDRPRACPAQPCPPCPALVECARCLPSARLRRGPATLSSPPTLTSCQRW